MGEIVRLCDRVAFDPILRKGDLVRIVDLEGYVEHAPLWIDTEEFDFECISGFEGYTGVVINIVMAYPDDHPVAPGQSAYVDIGVPFDSESEDAGWRILESVSIEFIRRIIGEDAHAFRGYTEV